MNWIDLAQGWDRWRALANADCDAGNTTHTHTHTHANTHTNHCILLPTISISWT
jgi:hypothetical protein